MNTTIIRSNRKTLGLELSPSGLIVRAPRNATDADISRFLSQHRRWIETHSSKIALQQAVASASGKLSSEDLRLLVDQARTVFAERVSFYAPIIGVDFGRITVRSQRSRWGSCSSKGNLSFNCLLLLAPSEVLDSVVVHELCHRKEMNHSPRFYAEVLRVLPAYREQHHWLREHGGSLMARLP